MSEFVIMNKNIHIGGIKMKTSLRLMSLILAVVMLFTVMASGCGGKKGSASFDASVEMTPLTASAEQNIFMYNPDRGYRTDLVLYVGDLIKYVGDETKLMNEIAGVFNIYFAGLKEPCSLAFAYIYLTPWHLSDLPEDAIKVIEAMFEYCRLRKYKLDVCFCYNNQYAINCHLSQENKDKLASECADEATILKHIDQLAPVIAEYKDCCFNIKNGFIGFVGEWAASFQWPEVNYDKITMAIVDKLCAPNGLYFSHRHPSYTESVRKNYPEWENIKWIGFNNCAFYGEQQKEGWHSGGFQLGDKEGWWEHICKTGAYYPVTGELYTSGAMNRYNAIVSGKEAILELAHHWHTTLSFWHCKYDASYDQINIMKEWEKQEINTNWLKAQGIIYDPNWFVDDNGNPVPRNTYEFIRDHLGYKLVADKVNLKTEGDKIKVDMSFKNYGFSAAFNLTSGFAVLDDKFNVVSEVNAGDPTKWYSHDPENWKSDVVLDHSVSAELDIPETPGVYYVSFYLKNTMGVGAQLSNSVQFENNQNLLYAFKVE